MQGSNPGGGCAATRRQNVADGDVLDEPWVEAWFGVNFSEYRTEIFLWTGILEATLAALRWKKRDRFSSGNEIRSTTDCHPLIGHVILFEARAVDTIGSDHELEFAFYEGPAD